MAQGGNYEYEIFVSYRRQPPISDWVRDYFYEELAQWLEAAGPAPARLFIDRDGIETGDEWPARLRQTLLRSAFLVAVWSPNYFRSRWCVAELHTMLAREKTLSMRTDEEPRGLVFPVKFNDGQYFPRDVHNIQHRDFSPWAFTAASFRQSPKFLEFQDQIKQFADYIASRLDDVPPWRPDFPVETPVAEGGHTVSLPRL